MSLRVPAVALAAGCLAATAASASAPLGPTPASSFTAVVRYPGGSELVAWQAPESLAVHPLSGRPLLGGTFARGGRVVYRYAAGSPVSSLTGTFAARPDAPPLLDPLRGPTDFVLARVRAGRLVLHPDGPSAWRARIFAPANKCAGFGSGTIELRLRRADLLPLSLYERHGAVAARDFTVTYRRVGGRLPASTFAPPRIGRVAYRDDKGFVRASPAAAARRLSYTPFLPRSLPAGFALVVSGWAKLSGTTGAEGAILPARELFAAVYRRGSEEIDLTQRLARAGDWSADPFGAECVRQSPEHATIGSARAVYAASPSTTPHLYWRSGRLLYTLSGPFPKAALVAIARSLRPVA